MAYYIQSSNHFVKGHLNAAFYPIRELYIWYIKTNKQVWVPDSVFPDFLKKSTLVRAFFPYFQRSMR